MVWLKEKNVGDAIASARLFDAETGHFDPTRMGNAQFHRLVVEISSFARSKLRQFRLNSEKLISCAVQLPIQSRP